MTPTATMRPMDTPALLHPAVVERAARALSNSDEVIGLRGDLTWSEMDDVEQDRFRRAVAVVLQEADSTLAEASRPDTGQPLHGTQGKDER